MKEIKRLALVLGCAVFFIAFYLLCAGSAQDTKEYYSAYDGSGKNAHKASVFLEEAVHQYVSRHMEKEIKITGVGDIMFYDYQTQRAYNSAASAFDFSPSFAYIGKYFDDSSYVLGNFEGTMAGKGQGASSNDMGYWADTTSLNFNVPEQAAKDLKTAGFDMLTTANNHVLDSGLAGVASTIDFITEAGLDQTGSFKSADGTRYVIKNVDGVNVGFIAYTAIMGTALDETNQHVVNYLTDYSETTTALVTSQIKEMKTKGADIVVVSMHFGDKYSSVVNEDQKSFAKALVAAGADVIFGSYPHVLQPMELITAADEDGNSRQGVAFYSLGNFLSSMQYQSTNGYPRDIGAIGSVTFGYTSEGVNIREIEIVPTYTDWSEKDIAVLPIGEFHDDEALSSARFENDEAAYLDKERINTGFTSAISTIIGDSGLEYTYSDYKYKIILEK